MNLAVDQEARQAMSKLEAFDQFEINTSGKVQLEHLPSAMIMKGLRPGAKDASRYLDDRSRCEQTFQTFFWEWEEPIRTDLEKQAAKGNLPALTEDEYRALFFDLARRIHRDTESARAQVQPVTGPGPDKPNT